MDAASGSVVALDLSNPTATTTTPSTNGYFDLSSPDREITSNGSISAVDCVDSGAGGLGAGGLVVVGAGDSIDALICDNNNNELMKLNNSSATPPPAPVFMSPAPGGGDCDDSLEAQLLAHLSMHSSMSLAQLTTKTAGDQSIDSGVAAGDSDEADCVVVRQPPQAVEQVAQLQRPMSSISGGSSSLSSNGVSGDDEAEEEDEVVVVNGQREDEKVVKKENSISSPSFLSLNATESFLQDQFFLNGERSEGEEEDDGEIECDKGDRRNGLDGSLEENSLQNGGSGFEQDCKICQNKLQSPRVLSCLHVFCESCLEAQLFLANGGDAAVLMDSASIVATPPRLASLTCPVCQQRTPISRTSGVAGSLHLDYVLTNILDLSSIDLSVLACTSCKGKEVAISRCNDCANILCASCDNAHQYMRCFEKHTVVRLQDLLSSGTAASAEKGSVAIHKPLFCTVHATENLKYYCQHCQVPVCNECLIGDHKGGEHSYEVIADAEQTARAELERLSRESDAQVEHCNEAQLGLDSALTELQSQHDTARALIEESYQSFKAVLERCKDNALKQLDTLHAERELKVMEVMHDVEKCTERIETANRFTGRVLSACNGGELLSLRALIGRQFARLAENIPRTTVSYSIEFESQFEQFQRVAQDTFGRFRTEGSAPSPKESTPPPTLPGMPPPPLLMMHREREREHREQQHQQHQQQQHHQQSQQQMMQDRSMNSGYHHQNSSQQQQRSIISSGGGGQNLSQSSLMGISAFNGTATSQNGAMTNSVTGSSPISLPPSMQSSFDGDMSALSQPPSSASTTGSVPSFGGLLVDHHSHHGMNSMSGGGSSSNNNSSVVVVPSMSVPPPSLVGAGPGGVGGVNGGPGGVAAGGLTSIAEYNIQQLANLVEQSSAVVVGGGGGVNGGPPGADMTDSILPAVVGPVSVPPPSATGPQGAITLNDILSIDPHALQAWSKMGGLNQQAANALLSRGPSPSVDNLLLNDFSAIAASGDDLMLTNFSANGNGGPGVLQQQQQNSQQQGQQSGQSIGVPGRTKSTAMQIRCKFGSLGPSKGQFNSPHGFCLGVDEEIVVADTNNHRIEVFEKTGTFKFQFGVPGKDEGQLWYPRKVAVMRPSSKFVVCDRGNERSRMQIFNKAGHFMKKIAIRYIDIVAGLAVTNQGHIVAVDSVSPTVFIISEEGDLVHWFDCSDYMREPSDIAINGNDFYVCDFKGHCVAVFSDDGTFKYRIGNEKITCFPNGIDISDAGDILIGDSHGNRFHVACFSRDGVLQSEYECPYVKVSRCCGLKITSEGFVVTLAKNNHHVLVLNTLYIQ